MNRYFDFLNTAAKEYHIPKGKYESELSWEARVIYSLLGQTGYSSLYDVQEDLSPDSIVHFKRRISDVLESILTMYPELNGVFSAEADHLTQEIYDVFSHTGCMYHKPNRVVPCMRKAARGKNSVFFRGQALDETKWISGLGSYLPLEKYHGTLDGTISRLFGIQETSLGDYWNTLTQNAVFEPERNDTGLEYLRTVPPFSSGYWSNSPDTSGEISLARNEASFGNLYYLYRFPDHSLRLSQLPSWRTDEYHYRNISAACLAARGVLPETSFHVDGSVVTIRIGYLFPPEEQELIKLYSWPLSYSDFPHDFERMMSLAVFEEIRACLEVPGYHFMEV